MTSPPTPHRPRGRIALALVFAVLGGGAWVQMFINFFSSEPRPLVAFHLCLAITGTAAAIGSWTMARWAPIAVLLYGASTVGLLLSLTSILKLDPDAGSGLRTGAAVVFAFSAWAAWYLHRSSRARAASENRAG
jgi:hypothetical protein